MNQFSRDSQADRSVRALHLTPKRTILMMAMGSLCFAVFPALHFLLQFHEALCRKILEVTGTSISDSALRVLPWIPAVAIPYVSGSVAPIGAGRILIMVLGVLILFGLLQSRYPMARSFLFFVSGLIVVATVLFIVKPTFTIPQDAFTLLWLRTQAVLWVLLPLLVALLIVPVEPSMIRAVATSFIMGAYGICWSAVRLAFCLVVLHQTGVVFVTALWFMLGPLGDLIYILFFYSVVIRQASIRLWSSR